MIIEIISPEKKVYQNEISLAQLPGIDGSFEILNNHAPMIAILKKGIVKVINIDGKIENIEIKGGTLEVLNNKILILAD